MSVEWANLFIQMQISEQKVSFSRLNKGFC